MLGSVWEFPRSRLRLQTVLGEGNFGKVWKAEADEICGNDGTILVAVKTVKVSVGSKTAHAYLWCHHTLNGSLIYINIKIMTASMKIKIINLHYLLQYITRLLMQSFTKEMKHKTSTIIKQFKSHKTPRF